MLATKEWENEGWVGISLGLKREEIDQLISLLSGLKDVPDQHFHLSSKYEGGSGVGDIEIYVQGDEPSNMSVAGFAIEPGTDVAKRKGQQ